MNVVLIRGLPGSGKTTLAKSKCQNPTWRMVAADDFFTSERGAYTFNPRHIGLAHDYARARMSRYLLHGYNVAVHNTFSMKWEMDSYAECARMFGASVDIIDLFDSGLSDVELFARNSHDVPIRVISRMRDRWER